MTLKISLITVVLNNQTFIRDAIDSVLSQTYPNIEYIIIDGGSSDDSLSIINEYKDKLKLISEPDKGIYDAMNKGLAMATGDIIGFLNSDDFYADADIVQQVADFFEAHNADAVYGDLDYVSLLDKHKVVRRWRSGAYKPELFYRGWMPPHPTFFVRSDVYKRCGGFNTQLKSAADYELMLRLALVHKIQIGYINQVWIKMRLGGQSNRSFRNRLKANLEDRKAWEINGLKPRWYTLLLKPVQKIPQYFTS